MSISYKAFLASIALFAIAMPALSAESSSTTVSNDPGAAASITPTAPDILLIMVDSLRSDALGCYGQTNSTSPSIDLLAAKGTRFEQAVSSAPWTQPSVMTAFSSLTPERHGHVLSTSPNTTNFMTLAESLKKAGYQTIGITANPMTHRRYGFARGFDFYDDFSIFMEPGEDVFKIADDSAAQVATGATVTRLADSWLKRRDPKRPLFLFLFYMDPHWDYLPPPPYDRMFTSDTAPPIRDIYRLGRKYVSPPAKARVRAAFAGEVRYTDTCIGQLVSSLQNSPRKSSTILLLCGDHGEAFWERGVPGHGNNLHEEEIRVPLIIHSMGAPENGAVVTGQVGLIDLSPTILDLAGIKAPSTWEGVSLKPLLKGGAASFRPLVLDNHISGGHVRGVRTSAFKVIGLPPFANPSEVYDLLADPGETNNLATNPNGIPPEAAELATFLQVSNRTVLLPRE